MRLRESKVSWQVCNKSRSTYKFHATQPLASGGTPYDLIKKISRDEFMSLARKENADLPKGSGSRLWAWKKV